MTRSATGEATAPPVALPCPDCVRRGQGGGARIGNARNRCSTCNRWVQAVRRETWRAMLAEVGPDRYGQLRAAAEVTLYPDVIARVGTSEGAPA